ncbi:hypothetical protein CTM97_19520 [Photobacterium phosphoreum]|uniref:Uncharacterized protein n=1 Tax=Photobacterium phosphoreum TaxID=659 RepID=A0A2T3JEX9_PHOPO|nr:hypothetical protein [Photobacterium phosphoreum]PSU21410.1 hypothetical protein CTM96_17940 [Photobacterium phosphoreum]PSU38228.1 hypothetical protein CTM97_19520 [Photobacterium phosphoreum]PSU47452.1 hypothetical protein C9J18_18970 [Photobacterium phosphoreum]
MNNPTDFYTLKPEIISRPESEGSLATKSSMFIKQTRVYIQNVQEFVDNEDNDDNGNKNNNPFGVERYALWPRLQKSKKRLEERGYIFNF